MLNNLSQRLAVIGARFERVFVDGMGPNGKPAAPVIRIVNHVQSNAVAFRVDADNASADYSNRSWFYFPKARDARFEGGKMILLDLHGRPLMTLEHLGDPQAQTVFQPTEFQEISS